MGKGCTNKKHFQKAQRNRDATVRQTRDCCIFMGPKIARRCEQPEGETETGGEAPKQNASPVTTEADQSRRPFPSIPGML